MPPETTDAELLELIGAIYDSAITPQLWWPTLERIRLHFGFQMAALGVSALPSGKAVVQVTANMSEEYAAAIPRYGEEVIAIWGGLQRAAQLPLEEPLRTTQVARREDWADNRFYLEWAVPQGIVDQVAIFLVRDQTMLGSLGLSIHESWSGPTDRHMQELRLLAPHIRRSVTISRLLEQSAEVASTFESALTAARSGIVIVDEDLSVVFANDSAEAMLRAGDPIRKTNGRLSLRQELAAGHLQAAVRIAASDEGQLARRGIAIPARLEDGKALAVHVMPLRRRREHTNFGARAAAAVFIADSGGPPILSQDALSLLYGLTPAETQVFELIVAGRSTKEVSYALGVAPSTMRTHLLAVFAKTGQHSRADLVRLSRELVLPD